MDSPHKSTPELSEELILMILTEALAVPGHRYYTRSPSIWGPNDHVSATDVLAVCKQWYRIGIVLLYHTMVIRSPAQAVALAMAFCMKPPLATLVQRFRIEGAYPRLDEIFTKCTNVHTVFLALWDILPSDDMTPLCNAISIMAPTSFYLVDRYYKNETRIIGNRNFRIVFTHLCVTIPRWTTLVDFGYTWVERPRSVWHVILQHRRERLATALASSTSLRRICSLLPSTWSREWQILAANPRIGFYFTHYSPSDYQLRHPELRQHLLEWPHLAGRVTSSVVENGCLTIPPPPTMARTVTAPTLQPQMEVRTPHRFTRQHMDYSPIWRRIFTLAMFDTVEPLAIQSLLLGLSSCYDQETTTLIETRDTIISVSIAWATLLGEVLAATPLVASVQELQELINGCKLSPDRGKRITTLTLGLIPLINIPPSDETLATLLPYLNNLVHFVSSPLLKLTAQTFQTLADVAGNTLETAMNIYVDHVAHGDRIAPVTANKFRRLAKLHFECPPKWDIRERKGMESFPSLQNVVFMTMNPCDDFYMLASYPCLRKVCFAEVTAKEEAFLKAVGKQIVELEVVLYDLESQYNRSFDLLVHCPVLRTLSLGHSKMCLSDRRFDCLKFLSNSAGNMSLDTLYLKVCISLMSEACRYLKAFFMKFNPFQFPNLHKIEFTQYDWPMAYRDIHDDYLVEASLLYESFGIVITDSSGTPFRKRLQHKATQRQQSGNIVKLAARLRRLQARQQQSSGLQMASHL